ncbi:site-specific DNA-methyltransferase [Seleniivibrio woodruffii]|uniref:site-specific DNA-methyltransferase (adenine-specific) n=1 Tax=Seleniivibrio woodruffii TaxID=1078050 RepID=A0A4R1K2Z7_9BACT|nr:DNA methyltransferase [Seleniivibrio woodruffii]TCK58425.1 adenine-specific DNA-methyltransferase [Seleniivibrio woodruffii]TVZ36798.1 adenine-specific DNA-methyltransferase [Seleniivibrio woodruffii]
MDKMDGKTLDIVQENINKLKEIFPEVFTEGKLDCDKLKEELGDFIDDREERYSFNWNGKRQAKLIAQTPSTGTIRPCPEESLDWENTKNIFIEGDNLEVLKLLQKSYYRKVKMIYIDPPYNTGKDFVYKDDFKDNIKNYKKITGQVDGEGHNISNNPETNGRYHTNWLNMMYPRLKLARNMLHDDGVILVSIGDAELSNLTSIMNEIFGEENRVAIFTWKSRAKPTNAGDAKFRPQKVAEYILVYGRRAGDELKFNVVPAKTRTYPHEDADGKYRTTTILTSNRGTFRRETMRFASGGYQPDEDFRWKAGKQTIDNLFQNNRILLNDDGVPQEKKYEHEEQDPLYPIYCFMEPELTGTAETGKSDLNEIVGNKHGLDTVKPVLLLKYLTATFSDEDDLIVDFFAGSCTTAQAVFELNAEQSSNRKVLLVQIPELINQDSEAFAAGFKSIVDIGKRRLNGVSYKLRTSIENYAGDLGFKVFKLDSTNIKPWEVDFDLTQRELEDYISNIKDDRNEHDILYEVLLKFGLDLTLPITEHMIDGQKVYDIGMGALMVCLSDNITINVAEGIVSLKEQLKPEIMRVVLKDSGFGDKELDANVVKANIIHILKDAGIEDVRSL